VADLESLDLGFAEFVAKLISEVVDAVALSQLQQEQRQAELAAAVRLDPEEFAERYVTEAEVDAELARRFPPAAPDQPHAIVPGAPLPPAIALETLGIELLPNRDFRKPPRGAARLEEPGVEKLRAAVRRQIAEERLAALGELFARGIARVLVDSGHVNAKLTFQVVTLKEAEAEPGLLLAAPLRPIGVLTGTPERLTFPDVRLVVRQADERSPQASTIQANVYGEVQVTFKTIT
jgi:hypothetical protein